MGQRLTQSIAVVAAAFVVAYAGLTSVSDVRDYVSWPAELVGLSIVSALCGGLLALIDRKAIWLMSLASVLSVLIFGSFGGRVFAERSPDLLAAFGLRARDPLRARRASEPHGFLVDSSAAIDGRVLELARSGLVSGPVSAPMFVVDELQGIADSGDRSRRRRGRRGLDVLDSLRSVEGVQFSVLEESVPMYEEVDAKLVALTARLEATLVTTDHNLAKAAQIRGLKVLNPHALGESMRPALVSGDRFELTVEREGSEPGQGVGFLDDGTMVVVEGGSDLVGETVRVEVANSLRTSVGRLMFARLEA